MFCKKCGKSIAEDSFFCQYCGEQLTVVESNKVKEKRSLFERIKSINKWWQIIIMLYTCLMFALTLMWIEEHARDEEWSIAIFTFTIILPVLSLFIWHYFTYLRFIGKSQKDFAKESDMVNLYSLVDFAKLHGKMQVKTEQNSVENTISYCVFTNTNSKEIRVDFSNTTTGMTPTEISSNKEKLFVVQSFNKTYKLIKTISVN